mmetsp:Transcript_28410/g.40103  ORF Transcript_28410/g.40103 Transcript_28410/m.40103 type:complete len:132 (+) Transcript_28410:74-469(+)
MQAKVSVVALMKDPNDPKKVLSGIRIPSGFICNPGGKVEEGESLVDAVHREISEEVGVKIKDPRYLCNIHTKDGWTVHFFLTTEWEGEIQNMEPDKNKGWFFADREEMYNKANPVFALRTLLDKYPQGFPW